MNLKPWITGPKELLIHGLQHLEIDTHFDNRIAMISIDNSGELMIKTYLTGSHPVWWTPQNKHS